MIKVKCTPFSSKQENTTPYWALQLNSALAKVETWHLNGWKLNVNGLRSLMLCITDSALEVKTQSMPCKPHKQDKFLIAEFSPLQINDLASWCSHPELIRHVSSTICMTCLADSLL
jgi:hypothetical protein